MAASINDKFTDAFNSANPNVARVTAGRSAAGATLTCDNLAGWPTGTAVHFSTYQINTSNTVVAGTQIDWKGIVSGNSIGTMTRQAGATDAGNSIGDVVEMNPTGSWAHDLFTGLTQEHSQLDGTHKAVTATSVTSTGQVQGSNLKLTTGNILDTNGNEEIKTVATASAVNEVTVTNAATGNAPAVSATGDDTNIDLQLKGKGTGVPQLFGGVIKGLVKNRQGGSVGDASWISQGTTTVDTSAKAVKIQVGSVVMSAGGDVTVTYPEAFSQVPLVFGCSNTAAGASTFAVISGITTTNFAARLYTGSARVAETLSWMAIGQ